MATSSRKTLADDHARRFLLALDSFDNLWDQLDRSSSVQYASDAAAVIAASTALRLALDEARMVARFLGLRANSSAMTDIAQNLADLQVRAATMVQRCLGRVEHSSSAEVEHSSSADPRPLGETPLPAELLDAAKSFNTVENRSREISGAMLTTMKARGVSTVDSLSNGEADSFFLPVLNQHRTLRRALGRADELGLDQADLARLSCAVRHAADCATYLAFRLEDRDWLQLKIDLLKLEAALLEALVRVMVDIRGF